MKVDINRKKTDYLISKIDEHVSEESFGMQIFFPNKKNYVAMIRDSLRHLFSHYSLDVKSVGRLVLVADELMNNAVTYGSVTGDINQFRIAIHLSSGQIRVDYEVQDTGKNHDARDSSQMRELIDFNRQTWHLDLTRQRGRGYHLITDICDEVTFRDAPGGGLIVCAGLVFRV